jgi:hypothetical protein
MNNREWVSWIPWLMVVIISLFILLFIPSNDNSVDLVNDSSNYSFPEKCLVQFCENVSVRVPGADLTCVDTLFMKDGSVYCNIEDLK